MELLIRSAFLAGIAGTLVACSQPPGPVAPRNATDVNAPQAKTWDAVIDVFADRNIPIRTMERVSGFIATDPLSVGVEDGVKFADCGKNFSGAIPATLATYNVLVRGDETRSTVKVTVRFTSEGNGCSTRGVWERTTEEAIKLNAEQKATKLSSEPSRTAPVEETTASTAPVELPPAVPSPSAAPAPTAATATPTRAKPPTAAPKTRPPTAGPGTGGIRTNAELMRSTEFSLAMGDAQRLGLVEGFRESGFDTLTVQLSDSAIVDPATDRIVSRLYSAYWGVVSYSERAVLLLRHGSNVVGDYSNAGLTKGVWEY